jgi:acetate kinase
MPTAQLIALSDSVFHATIPSYARVYGIAPFLTRTHDLYRFGYHGISCASIIEKLSRGLFKGKKLPSRIIICHAGGGTSITAVRDGISVDTSMGYSPLSGVMMSTRSGDIDPAIVVQLMKKLNKSSTEVVALLAYASGSESFSSVKQARQIYLYQIQKFIGSYTAVLGGVDLIVFTGGRGEHDAVFRQEVCERLAGISVDSKKNEYGNEDRFIHDPLSHCSVAVVSTNEMAYMCSLINR